MAFNMPEGPAEEDEAPIFAEVTITPLTDVILVMLIIVMVSANAMVDAARQGRLDVELPSAGSGASAELEADALVISILRDGRVAFGGDLVDDASLGETLAARAKENANRTVVIDADGDLAHKSVVRVLDLARRAGFVNIGIGVSPE